MKKSLLLLLLYAVATTMLLIFGYRRHRNEVNRLSQNQITLSTQAALYRNRLNEASASVQALRLRCAEFEELRADDAERIRKLGLQLRRIESVATSVATTDLTLATPLPNVRPDSLPDDWHDSLTFNAPSLSGGIHPAHAEPNFAAADSARRHFRWRDPWYTVDGVVTSDSVFCRVTGVDTLRQIVHRIPHRFLFIRWGTKALRQEISSSNPHTRIVYTEYIRLER